MGAGKVSDLVGVADIDMKRGFSGLFDAHTGLCLSRRSIARSRLDWWGYSRAGRNGVILVVVQIY